MLETGLSHTSSIVVGDGDTAIARGSGDMPVLATPSMLALMENAAMLAVAGELPEGCTTVGGSISSSHLAPSVVGAEVRAHASLEKIDGRKLYFNVIALEGDKVLGEGTHLRFIVDRRKFLQKLGAE